MEQPLVRRISSSVLFRMKQSTSSAKIDETPLLNNGTQETAQKEKVPCCSSSQRREQEEQKDGYNESEEDSPTSFKSVYVFIIFLLLDFLGLLLLDTPIIPG